MSHFVFIAHPLQLRQFSLKKKKMLYTINTLCTSLKPKLEGYVKLTLPGS